MFSVLNQDNFAWGYVGANIGRKLPALIKSGLPRAWGKGVDFNGILRISSGFRGGDYVFGGGAVLQADLADLGGSWLDSVKFLGWGVLGAVKLRDPLGEAVEMLS